jgi:hypothetical protein
VSGFVGGIACTHRLFARAGSTCRIAAVCARFGPDWVTAGPPLPNHGSRDGRPGGAHGHRRRTGVLSAACGREVEVPVRVESARGQARQDCSVAWNRQSRRAGCWLPVPGEKEQHVGPCGLPSPQCPEAWITSGRAPDAIASAPPLWEGRTDDADTKGRGRCPQCEFFLGRCGRGGSRRLLSRCAG